MGDRLGTPGAIGFFLVALVYKIVFFFLSFLSFLFLRLQCIRTSKRGPKISPFFTITHLKLHEFT